MVFKAPLSFQVVFLSGLLRFEQNSSTFRQIELGIHVGASTVVVPLVSLGAVATVPTVLLFGSAHWIDTAWDEFFIRARQNRGGALDVQSGLLAVTFLGNMLNVT